MSKYKIGTQWKTKCGNRAVIVEIPERGGTFRAWHSGPNGSTAQHRLADGGICNYADENEDDLIEPWKEPVVQKGWINIWANCGRNNTVIHPTRRKARKGNASPSVIACIEIEFTEGEGL